jgi:hypothetical protein
VIVVITLDVLARLVVVIDLDSGSALRSNSSLGAHETLLRLSLQTSSAKAQLAAQACEGA